MDKLLAVFIIDNALRKTAGMKPYPLPMVNHINKVINTKEQALKYEKESYNEVQQIIKTAYPPRGVTAAVNDAAPPAMATTPTDHYDSGDNTESTFSRVYHEH